ncbi:MAG TPA: DUF3293 domain-containing protein [Herbaspirillum sp.]|jgi:hypothetical protein|nr:DUF3293 domain-containing protein [Herbaspirillum sp.]
MSAISAELIADYRAATYRVDSPTRTINLTINAYSKELESLHAHYQVASSAFITAYNPYSEPTAPEVNRASQEALMTQIEALHLPSIPGAGVCADSDSLPEPSVLILGISFEQASALAHQYRQNAFIFSDKTAIPRLHLCR